MIVLAIDPGPVQSAWVEWNTGYENPLQEWGKHLNHDVLDLLCTDMFDYVVIEDIRSYGMAVGIEVFETCKWIGRFTQQHSDPDATVYLTRNEIKNHICGSSRAKDSNIRQALIDMFSTPAQDAIGLKKTPGPLYGIKSDIWAALAVAVTFADTRLTNLEAA